MTATHERRSRRMGARGDAVVDPVAYLMVLTLTDLQNAPQDRVGTLMLQNIFGSAGAYVMAAAILFRPSACINGLILAGARVYYAMARDGLFFQTAGRLSKHDVPAVSLVFQGIWTAFLTLTGTYGQLLDYVIFAALIFYVRPDMPRPIQRSGTI